MSDSIISMFFLGVLGILFILLVVLTIVLIVTRKKGDEEEYDEYDEGYDPEENYDNGYNDDGNYDDGNYEDGNYDNGDYDDGEGYDDNYAGSDDYGDNDSDGNEMYYDEEYDESHEEESDIDSYQKENDHDDDVTDEPVVEESNDAKKEINKETEKDDINDESDEGTDKVKTDAADNGEKQEEKMYGDELGDYSDSAFAPYKEEEGIYNEEAIIASVKEAEAMSEAVIYGKNDTEAMFGISDELDSYKKKPVKRSTVSSTDEFYWFNKMDVAEKPSYKTKEMYYHYFNLPKDCIEELLVEMYDCALVRTEEIRYIAYGIEPKAVSIKDILSEGNYYYSDQPKKKEPMPQDLIKIYEKWCGYVDKLFDKVEIHADEFTIQEIRKMLYEYGRNDVDVILEGK